jgi:hypothetical protein
MHDEHDDCSDQQGDEVQTRAEQQTGHERPFECDDRPLYTEVKHGTYERHV